MEQCKGICGVWGTPALTVFEFHNSGTNCFSPRVLGNYFHLGEGAIPNLDNRAKVKLTSWITNERENLNQDQSVSNKRPEIASGVIDDVKNRKDLEVEERANFTINFLRSNSSKLGTVVTISRFNEEDASLPLKELENKYEVLYKLLCVSECADEAELGMVLNRLHRQKDIEFYRADSDFKVMM